MYESVYLFIIHVFFRCYSRYQGSLLDKPSSCSQKKCILLWKVNNLHRKCWLATGVLMKMKWGLKVVMATHAPVKRDILCSVLTDMEGLSKNPQKNENQFGKGCNEKISSQIQGKVDAAADPSMPFCSLVFDHPTMSQSKRSRGASLQLISFHIDYKTMP